mgnify:CR=1 FL=1
MEEDLHTVCGNFKALGTSVPVPGGPGEGDIQTEFGGGSRWIDFWSAPGRWCRGPGPWWKMGGGECEILRGDGEEYTVIQQYQQNIEQYSVKISGSEGLLGSASNPSASKPKDKSLLKGALVEGS